MFKVFQAIDKDFSSNGDAVILRLRAVVKKVDNSDYTLELEAGIEYADYLRAKNIIVAPTPTGLQPFRIENPEATRTKIRATCRHAFYDAENYLIADSYVVDKDCNDALDHLNSATDTPSPFTTLSDITAVNSYRCVRTSLLEAVNVVLERWGGHLVRDGFNIQIKQSIGADNGVTIQYKKNLKDISVTYDWTDVCTKLLPVGKDGFTLESLYVYGSTQYDLPFTKTITFEQAIEREDYADDEQYYSALRDDLTAQAEAYLSAHDKPAVNYTLSADLEKITDIGDVIRVYDERLGVDILTHVLSFEYDAIQGRYLSVEFGTATPNLNNLLSSVNNVITDKITISEQTQTAQLNVALANSEAKILGVMGDSYVIYNGNELLAVDSLPASTATNVLRLNSEGIAFSNTGISGHFTSAWQIDGTFNAQAINLINLTASMIKGGTLKLGSNLNESGILEVYDEANNLIAQLDKGGLKMFAQNGTYILINPDVGFCGYDSDDSPIFYVREDEFVMKKAIVEQEITLCDKLRFIPVELYDSNNNLVNDGVGLVSV
jgi:phage minor structural protein